MVGLSSDLITIIVSSGTFSSICLAVLDFNQYHLSIIHIAMNIKPANIKHNKTILGNDF
jgi:hypothetical protein